MECGPAEESGLGVVSKFGKEKGLNYSFVAFPFDALIFKETSVNDTFLKIVLQTKIDTPPYGTSYISGRKTALQIPQLCFFAPPDNEKLHSSENRAFSSYSASSQSAEKPY